jgi:Lar family restriction alleviation protein
MDVRPCPFCNSYSVVGLVAEVNREDIHRVMCKECSALGPPQKTVEEAITAWNDRFNAEAEDSSKLLVPIKDDGSSSMRS